jgi:hypothetical protein
MTCICWSRLAFMPTSVERNANTAAAIRIVVSASTPKMRGCAAIDW